MITVILKYSRIYNFKNEQELKKSVEYLSRYPDVINVEVIPFEPTDKDKRFNDVIRERFGEKKNDR